MTALVLLLIAAAATAAESSPAPEPPSLRWDALEPGLPPREGLFAGAPAYVGYGKTMVNESYDKVGSPITIGMKDAVSIAGAAQLAKVPMPSHDVYFQRLVGAIAHGEGDLDQAGLAREQSRASGLE